MGSEIIRGRYSRSMTRATSQLHVGRRSLYATLSVIAAISWLRADSIASRLAPLGAAIGIHDAHEASERERLHAQPAEAVRAPEYLFEMKGTAPYGRVTHPGAMSAAPDGSVYVADEEDHRITRFDRDGNVLSAWGAYGAGDGQFDMPIDVAVAPDGSVYVSDGGNFRVQRFTTHGKHITTWGRQGVDDGSFRGWLDYQDVRGPGAIAVDASGLVLVDDPGRQRIQVFSSDGTFLHAWTYMIPGTSTAGGEREIAALRVSPDNTLVMLTSTYVEASRDPLNLVRRFDLDGRLVDEWDISAELDGGVGLAISAEGTIYISNRLGFPRVGVFTADGVMIERLVDKDDPEARILTDPVGIALAPDGTGYIGDVWRHRLWRFDVRSGVEIAFAVGPRAFGQQQPRSIATAPDGTFYVSSDERVHRFNGRSELFDVFEPDPLDEGLETLSDIVVGPFGRVFGVEEYTSRVHVFEGDGTPVGAWGEEGKELGELFGPRWITLTPVGDILVYESTPGRIQRWTQDGSPLGLWLGSTYMWDIRSVPDDSADGYEILSLEGTCLVRRSPDARVIVQYDVYPDRPEMSCFRTMVGASSDRGGDGTAMKRVGGTSSTHATHWTSPSGVASIPIGPRAASRIPDGSYIVMTESELRHFSSSGALMSVQGGFGSRAGTFLNASDLVVMPDTLDPDGPIPPGAVIVADSENHRLQVFGARRPLWRVELFDNPWLMGYPAHITTTRAVNLDWGAPRPALVAPAERFSARIERRLYLSGTLDIRLETLGGARMWVGDELVVDDWLAESVVIERSLEVPYDDYLVRLELNGTESVSSVKLDLDIGEVPTPTLTPWPTDMPPFTPPTPWPTDPPTSTPRPRESPVPTPTLTPPPTLVIVPPSSTRTPVAVAPVYLPAAHR